MKPILFIWIPKAAGTSVWETLAANCRSQKVIWDADGKTSWKLRRKHPPFDPTVEAVTFRHAGIASVVEAGKLTEEEVDRRFKFAFVRNPWDRLVSLYEYLHKLGDGTKVRRRLLRSRVKTFPRFIESACDLDSLEPVGCYNWRGVSQANSQLDWLRYDGRMLPDFIGKFERLRADWQTACDLMGIRAPLPHSNRTKHRHYGEYYDERLRRLVTRRYAEEIEMFKYCFRESSAPDEEESEASNPPIDRTDTGHSPVREVA